MSEWKLSALITRRLRKTTSQTKKSFRWGGNKCQMSGLWLNFSHHSASAKFGEDINDHLYRNRVLLLQLSNFFGFGFSNVSLLSFWRGIFHPSLFPSPEAVVVSIKKILSENPVPALLRDDKMEKSKRCFHCEKGAMENILLLR